MNPIDQLKAVLCDSSGKCCIDGSDEDRAIVDRALKELAKPEQEPVAWRNAAIRLGEDLYSVGPNGYYEMTAKQWLDWALSVVNTAPPRKEWVGLTQEPTACGYDETVGMCTNNPCCEQTPVAHLWECIGRWSAYLASNGEKANLAPPEWLVDAVKAATAPPRKPWQGLTGTEINHIFAANVGYPERMCHAIEAKLKEKNNG
jgi:hypothetical protein